MSGYEYMGVSNTIGVPPNHPILIRFSIINHPFWGTPIFGNTHIWCVDLTTKTEKLGKFPAKSIQSSQPSDVQICVNTGLKTWFRRTHIRALMILNESTFVSSISWHKKTSPNQSSFFILCILFLWSIEEIHLTALYGSFLRVEKNSHGHTKVDRSKVFTELPTVLDSLRDRST